jgi:hypothetical protein
MMNHLAVLKATSAKSKSAGGPLGTKPWTTLAACAGIDDSTAAAAAMPITVSIVLGNCFIIFLLSLSDFGNSFESRRSFPRVTTLRLFGKNAETVAGRAEE